MNKRTALFVVLFHISAATPMPAPTAVPAPRLENPVASEALVLPITNFRPGRRTAGHGSPVWGQVQRFLRQLVLSESGSAVLIPEDPAATLRAYHQRTLEADDARLNGALGLTIKTGEKSVAIADIRERFRREAWTYVPTVFVMIRAVIERLTLTPSDVFYDLGSGYGQVVLYTALVTAVRKAVGVEIVPERVRQSREAGRRLGLDHAEFIEAHIEDAALEDGTVFFLFSPFNVDSLQIALEKLRQVAERHPIRIVFHGPFTEWLMALDWLTMEDVIEEGTRIAIVFRSNLPAADAPRVEPPAVSREERPSPHPSNGRMRSAA